MNVSIKELLEEDSGTASKAPRRPRKAVADTQPYVRMMSKAERAKVQQIFELIYKAVDMSAYLDDYEALSPDERKAFALLFQAAQTMSHATTTPA